MGHTTRMIALAEKLENKHIQVIFALPKALHFLLDNHKFEIRDIGGYNIKYYKHLNPILSLILQLPKIIKTFIKEPYIARQYAKKHNIDIIISDNRPFFRTKTTKSVYVTHQTQLPIKNFIGKIIQKIYNLIIDRFDLILIPDFPDNRLAGKLSKPDNIKKPFVYCGPLSQYTKTADNKQQKYRYHVTYIASGPQPQRDIMTKKVLEILSQCEGKYAVVGNNSPPPEQNFINIDSYGMLPKNKIAEIINLSKAVASHSGYTTIMDCHEMAKPLIMWPTKGQSEQEYLAEYLNGKKGFYLIQNPAQLKDMVTTTLQPPEKHDNLVKNIATTILTKLNNTK